MKDLYLIHTWGDVEPILHGPFKHERSRSVAFRKIEHAKSDQRDGVYKLDVDFTERRVWVEAYSGVEAEEILAQKAKASK